MNSKIIKHLKFEDVNDDTTHPIPSLHTIDVQVTKKTGGADLFIVVAQPLMPDDRSQTRLLDKIEGYLKFLLTPEFQREAGSPSPENTSIIVNINSKSDQVIFDLLERSKDWVLKNKASLKIALLRD